MGTRTLKSFMVVALLALPAVSSAQTLDSTDPFSLTLTPSHPAPYSRATLTLTSNTADLTGSTVTVFVNNTQIYKGNAQPLAITLGAGGVLTSIKVVAASGGKTYTRSLSVRPQDVSVVAEPIASVPPLYPGKPLVPIDGSVRVVAIANVKDAKGTTIDPLTLSYVWRVDDTQIFNSSGIGKNSIIVASPLQYRERTVSVTVESQDKGLGGKASLSLTPQEPVVRLYENDPLLGILFDRAVTGSLAIAGAEKSLYAAPFSFANQTGAPLLRWFLNGQSAQTGSLITLRPTGAGKGSASLSLVASGGSNTSATASLSLSFGAPTESNFFGL